MPKRKRKLIELGLLLLVATITLLAVLRLQINPNNYYHITQTPKRFKLITRDQSKSIGYNLTDLPLDDQSRLLNVTNFKFLINNDVCSDPEPPLILNFVHSAPGNFKHRETIRNTWGRELKIVFLLGQTSTTLQKHIENEDMSYRDIVQGNFIDSYGNLTYKHIMGHKWALYHCPGAKYILKTDDDVLVNVTLLKKYIQSKLSVLGARDLILCDINLTIVQRSHKSRWRVPHKDYPDRWYPPFCNGWAILYSPDVSFKLYSMSSKTKFFWIDDVFVTGILPQLINLPLTSVFPWAIYRDEVKPLLSKSSLDPSDDFLFCYPDKFLPQMNKLWTIILNTKRYSEMSSPNDFAVR